MPRLSHPALLLVPLMGFMVLTYLVPFLGVAAWSVTLPEPGTLSVEARFRPRARLGSGEDCGR